jgi:uncharacterized membrane protein YozB (DUF420 family)
MTVSTSIPTLLVSRILNSWSRFLFTPDKVIPVLKILVATVTLLLIASSIAIATGRRQLHGRINTAFFFLTMTTVLGLEVIIRFVNEKFTAAFSADDRQALFVHLCFAVPSAIVLPFMLFSGKAHRSWHVKLATLFVALWIGTFVTGIFYLPHSFPK